MKFSPWINSLRPKTLPLALSAVLVGNALAYWQNTFSIWVMLLTLTTASLLQILSNLANDYGDAIKGSDKPDRVGPLRGIQKGLITLSQLRMALVINVSLCMISGLALLFVACSDLLELVGFIVLGLLAIVAAITYTVGKSPYGYIGLGDLSVLIFFGLVSVIGSYYLQTKAIKPFLIFPAIGCGLLSVAVLNINNLRDFASDLRNNKRTFIVLIGEQAGRYYHALLLVFSFALLAHFSYHYLHTAWSYLFVILLPGYILLIRSVFISRSAQQIAPLLFSTVKLALLTNLLYCVGIILA